MKIIAAKPLYNLLRDRMLSLRCSLCSSTGALINSNFDRSRRLYGGLATLVALLSLTGCLGMPEKVTPVQGFNVQPYLGKWYEIARLDHSFERGMEQVSAEYTLKEDGGIRVLNRGYVTQTGQWKDAEGKAYFVNKENEGYLKVSFFGPFYGSYVIFELDQNYEYAFVSGPDTTYLWLLARKPHIAPEIIERFKTRAKELGFKTENLIFVKHP